MVKMNKEELKELNKMVDPLVAMLFKESISGKVVLSGLSTEARDGLGPYWVVYACIEHLGGVKTLPVTFGRVYPELDENVMGMLHALGNVIVIKERDRFTPSEASILYDVFSKRVENDFTEATITQSPGEYFDVCCNQFPGEVTNNMRKQFVAFQSKIANDEVAGA